MDKQDVKLEMVALVHSLAAESMIAEENVTTLIQDNEAVKPFVSDEAKEVSSNTTHALQHVHLCLQGQRELLNQLIIIIAQQDEQMDHFVEHVKEYVETVNTQLKK